MNRKPHSVIALYALLFLALATSIVSCAEKEPVASSQDDKSTTTGSAVQLASGEDKNAVVAFNKELDRICGTLEKCVKSFDGDEKHSEIIKLFSCQAYFPKLGDGCTKEDVSIFKGCIGNIKDSCDSSFVDGLERYIRCDRSQLSLNCETKTGAVQEPSPIQYDKNLNLNGFELQAKDSIISQKCTELSKCDQGQSAEDEAKFLQVCTQKLGETYQKYSSRDCTSNDASKYINCELKYSTCDINSYDKVVACAHNEVTSQCFAQNN